MKVKKCTPNYIVYSELKLPFLEKIVPGHWNSSTTVKCSLLYIKSIFSPCLLLENITTLVLAVFNYIAETLHLEFCKYIMKVKNVHQIILYMVN
jgi:hypothetical protein